MKDFVYKEFSELIVIKFKFLKSNGIPKSVLEELPLFEIFRNHSNFFFCKLKVCNIFGALVRF